MPVSRRHMQKCPKRKRRINDERFRCMPDIRDYCKIFCTDIKASGPAAWCCVVATLNVLCAPRTFMQTPLSSGLVFLALTLLSHRSHFALPLCCIVSVTVCAAALNTLAMSWNVTVFFMLVACYWPAFPASSRPQQISLSQASQNAQSTLGSTSSSGAAGVASSKRQRQLPTAAACSSRQQQLRVAAANNSC